MRYPFYRKDTSQNQRVIKGKILKLEIELAPSTVGYSSLYRLLPREVWNNIRNEIIKENGKIDLKFLPQGRK